MQRADIPQLPRFRLTTLPSPIERVERFEDALRVSGVRSVPRIYLKRDDLLSLGMGGNKIRNLELLIADALAQGRTDVVTSGRQQSNHCRLTAAACARAGVGAHLVFTGRRPAKLTGNLLIDGLFGAAMHFAGSDDRADRESLVAAVAAEIEDAGRTPYVVPVGGSGALGAVGHAYAAEELLIQLAAIDEHPAAIVLATATAGTQAGLLVGLRALPCDTPVYGFAVARSAGELMFDALRIAGEVGRHLSMVYPEFAAPPIGAQDVHVDGSQFGEGYGITTPAAHEALTLLARSEGILADPVYTAKGLAGLIAMVRDGRFSSENAVVFLHTGGAPALFA